MYRTVICATLSGLLGCAAAPSDHEDFALAPEPLELVSTLTDASASEVSKVADASAEESEPTQPGGDCQVVLSIDVGDPLAHGMPDGGAPFIVLDGGAASQAELQVWAQNRSPRAVRFRYLSPGCPAPALLLGLPEGYDAYGVCGLPACDREAGGAQVVLRPGQRVSLGRARVSRSPTACNATGLAPGRYVLTATLGEVEGARACAREPLVLEVR